MTKTFKQFINYRPKSKDEQRFVDKHVVQKHEDRNGNGDDVFSATNVKTINREEEHGYNDDTSKAVYENKKTDKPTYEYYVTHNTYEKGNKLTHSKPFKTMDDAKDHIKAKRLMGRIHKVDSTGRVRQIKNYDYGGGYGGYPYTPGLGDVDHKKKFIKEDTEQLDEISKKTLGSYIKKAHSSANATVKRAGNLEKFAKEKKINVKNTMEGGKDGAKYKDLDRKIKNRDKGIDRATNRLTKEDIISLTIQKLIPEDRQNPTREDILISRLSDLSESHIKLLVNLYASLDESNQIGMLRLLEDSGQIPELLDFALDQRDI